MSTTSDKAYNQAVEYKKLVMQHNVRFYNDWSSIEDRLFTVVYGNGNYYEGFDEFFNLMFEWDDRGMKQPHVQADRYFDYWDTTLVSIASSIVDVATFMTDSIAENWGAEFLYIASEHFIERDLVMMDIWETVGLPMLPEIKTIKERLTLAKHYKDKRGGYVYLVQAIAPQTYFKIGRSKDAVTRIKSMGVKLPFPIEPIHIMKTNDMYIAEKELHEKYAAYRIDGEWFQLTAEHVNQICENNSYIVEVAS